MMHVYRDFVVLPRGALRAPDQAHNSGLSGKQKGNNDGLTGSPESNCYSLEADGWLGISAKRIKLLRCIAMYLVHLTYYVQIDPGGGALRHWGEKEDYRKQKSRLHSRWRSDRFGARGLSWLSSCRRLAGLVGQSNRLLLSLNNWYLDNNSIPYFDVLRGQRYCLYLLEY